MLNKQYDYWSLIEAYIEVKSNTHEVEALRAYYLQRFDALSHHFDIHFDFWDDGRKEGSTSSAALMLFRSTVDSYNAIRTPMSGYLEFSDVELAEIYEKSGIETLAESNRQAHFKLLDTLFGLIYGNVETVVTSEMLLQAGFDDSNEPEL